MVPLRIGHAKNSYDTHFLQYSNESPHAHDHATVVKKLSCLKREYAHTKTNRACRVWDKMQQRDITLMSTSCRRMQFRILLSASRSFKASAISDVSSNLTMNDDGIKGSLAGCSDKIGAKVL